MKRLAHLVFWIAQIPAALAIAAGALMQTAGGWVIDKEKDLRR